MDTGQVLEDTRAKASDALDHAAAAGQHMRTDAERAVDRTAHQVNAAVDGMAKNAHGVMDDAKSAMDDARAKAEDLGSQAANKGDDALHATGEHLSELADTVRAKAPATGPVGEWAASGAEALDRSGAYLQQAELSGVRKDLETVIRRHPVQALVVGLGLGYLVARAMRS